MNDLSAITGLDAAHLGRLKIELLISGVRVSDSAQSRLAAFKSPIRTRSGVSGGLDLRLAERVNVNCAVNEAYARRSPFRLEWVDDGFVLSDERDDLRTAVELVRRPAYYDQTTTSGVPMVEIGQMCSADRLCIGLSRSCTFWRRDLRCTYCSIGKNTVRESAQRSKELILEVVRAAAVDPVLPARHILLGGGTPPGDDHGALLAAEIIDAIKAESDLPIYAMVVPPTRDEDLDVLLDSGVDELGMNLEFFSPEALHRYAPGKATLLGRDRYFSALERAVARLGPTNTRSILIVGLEPREATLAGVEELARRGVMPILSPFLPLDGSDLVDVQGWSVGAYLELLSEAETVCRRYGLVPGPTCVACQNNTLSLPWGEAYRYY